MTEFEEYIARLAGFFTERLRDPRIGHHPMTKYEGELTDRVARGEPVPEHPSTCSSAPFRCWHGQVWHKQRSGRTAACNVPGCQCLGFVSQRTMPAARARPGAMPGTTPVAVLYDELMLFDASEFK